MIRNNKNNTEKINSELSNNNNLVVTEFRLMRGFEVIETIKVSPDHVSFKLEDNELSVHTKPITFKVPIKGYYTVIAVNKEGTTLMGWNCEVEHSGDIIRLS